MKCLKKIFNLPFMGCILAINSGCLNTNNCLKPSTELLPCPIESIPATNEANVQLPGSVKAYGVNRYIDPGNPNIMHERHVVYRVESDPTWKLNTQADKQILIGNTYTNSPLNYSPAIMNQELALELQRQRLANSMLSATSETLIDTSLELQKQAELLEQRNAQLNRN